MQLTPFDIPEQMRDAADNSVNQAKKAFVDFIDATQKAVAKVEGSAKTLGEGAADVNRQALAMVEENVAASFEVARRLVRARTLEEVAVIQQEFVQRQLRNLAEQGKSLGQMMGRATNSAAKKTKNSTDPRR
jgi:phasin